MREVVLRIPRRAVEDALDRLLLILPGGVREVPSGRHVELTMRGHDLPGVDEIKRAAGRWPHRLSERHVPDDWRERRVRDYEPDPISGRLVVRPEWAPRSAAPIEIVLGESGAFGTATHPTTRACLELLLALPVLGSFADLGCGTGVLAIAAARLGWSPVSALDVSPESVTAACENARRNRAELTVRLADLSAEPPPVADALAANVPPPLHLRLASVLPAPLPATAILSGFESAASADVGAAYGARGLQVQQRLERHGWGLLVLKRD